MNDLIEKLIRYDLVNYLASLNIGQDNSIELFNEEEILQLCKYASILALSNKDSEQILAYEISTKLFINFHKEYPNLYSIAFSILSRLGNFPNRDLLKKYLPSERFQPQNFLLVLEKLAREKENQLTMQEDELIFLTDFQKIFFDVLTDKKFFSVSAPTSAGKSFVFTLAIIQRLLKNSSEVIVLIVPTRALIKELSEKIIKQLKKYNMFEKTDVRVVPIVEDGLNNKGRVYVLTQERLSALLEQDNIKIDTCFVDEAQEIQSNRGVVLQNTIELLIKKFPVINLFFASPLIKNPEYFNKLFKQNFDNEYFIENISPVGQNILLLSEIKNETKCVAIENIDSFSRRKDLGKFKLDFKFRGNEKIISLVKQISKDDELTLIYCNGASEAENRALSLAKKISDINDEEINSLINFIKEDIHKDYSIIQCLKKGIAYHYGHMPSSIKTEIENLASGGKLRFVFCTSTLLQGVNLPAKNIIVSRPNKGNNQPMNRADFLNLIGRAGRLLHEFQGNIWCIEPDQWDEKSFEGDKLQEIEAYFESALLSKTEKIIEIARNQNSDNNEVTVFGKFYSDFIIDKQNIDKFQQHNNYSEIQNLFDISKQIVHKLPNEIIKKHYSIHPIRLQTMYDFLQKQHSLENFTPKKAYQKNTNDNLKLIFQQIDFILLNKGHDNQQYKLFSLFASSWIHDKPMSQIILERNAFKEENINSTIREVLEIIEKQIRYTYVVATHAYLDILKLVLVEKNKDFDIDAIPNLPLYLECGTSDKTVLNLIALGLSRLTSIKLKNSKQFFCDEPTVSNCFNALQKINIEILDIPEVCKNEIKGLIL